MASDRSLCPSEATKDRSILILSRGKTSMYDKEE